MEGHETFGHLIDLLLLAPREFGDGFEDLAEAAAGGQGSWGGGLAEKAFDGDTEHFGERGEHLRARNLTTALPAADVGVRFSDLAGDFTGGWKYSLRARTVWP